MMKQLNSLRRTSLNLNLLTDQEEAMYQGIINYKAIPGLGGFSNEIYS